MEEKVIVFNLGDSEYGIKIEEVNAVVSLKDMVILNLPLSENNNKFIGCVNIRNTVTSIISLYEKYGCELVDINHSNNFLIVLHNRLHCGLLVNQLPQTITIKKDNIDTSFNNALLTLDEYFDGLINLPASNRIITLLTFKNL